MSLGPHLLGRVAPKTDAHLRAYPFAVAASVANVEVEIKRPTLSLYDQGQTPRCVGYSLSKIVNHFNGYVFDPDWLYAEAKKVDGNPLEDGTNAAAACDVLRREGHWRVWHGHPVRSGPNLKHGIASNRWATSVDAIRTVLASKQPVALGIDWHEAWFTPEAMFSGEYWLQSLAAAGRVAGGHEIGVWAASDKRQAFGLSNTWGAAWPSLVWIAYATVDALLGAGGDCCVITDLVTR